MIYCEGLTKTYEEHGVCDINFEVQGGQSLGILGPLSIEKTLVLKAVLGLVKPDDGQVTLFGKNSWEKRHEILGKVSYVPASSPMEQKITGEDYLNFTKKYYGGFNPQKARRITEALDVPLTGQIRKMSLEQRKKLVLLSALCRDADIFLLDEPMKSLSPSSKNALIDLLKDLQTTENAWLITSHVLDEVRRVCSHVSIMRQGRIIVSHPVEALNLTRQKVYHITFSDSQEAADFAQEWEAGVELIGARAMVAIPASPQALIKTLARYQVHDLIGGREETEENFLRYHGDDMI